MFPEADSLRLQIQKGSYRSNDVGYRVFEIIFLIDLYFMYVFFFSAYMSVYDMCPWYQWQFQGGIISPWNWSLHRHL